MQNTNWEDKAKNLLKSEMKKKGLTYRQLKNMIEANSIHYDEQAIINKVNRGKFSFAFFLLCMSAMNIKKIHLE